MLSTILNNPDFLLGILAAFGGCSIRYGEYYKKNKVNVKFYLVDALTAVFLGAYVYIYLVQDLGVSAINACLFNIIVGNLGSRAITVVCNLVKKHFGTSSNLFK